MGPTLRTAQVLKQEAEELGFEGKELLDYVKEQRKLDREDRAEWRKIRMAELQAEEKKRADESEDEKRADEIRIAQIEVVKKQSKIEADKELKIKESYKLNKLKLPPVLQPLHPLVIKMPSGNKATIIYRQEGQIIQLPATL